MVEVFAELAVAHSLLQVLVGGGDDADIGLDRGVAADAVEVAVGEHAQQPGLQFGGHVADLVQEQRAAFGLFEAAAAGGQRAGERAFSWPNSSDSSKSLGMAAVLSAMKGGRRAPNGGAALRRPFPCRCRIHR